ncbi:DUF6207 family protein [Streptomyces sp. R44]|uniref:DUF6207 family protein n=1 Tax=Streptomyces sp. R44 TaxID=3238633 RepID=A0AB39SL25_9ACTN
MGARRHRRHRPGQPPPVPAQPHVTGGMRAVTCCPPLPPTYRGRSRFTGRDRAVVDTTVLDESIVRAATAVDAARWATAEVPEVRRTPGGPGATARLFVDTRHSGAHCHRRLRDTSPPPAPPAGRRTRGRRAAGPAGDCVPADAGACPCRGVPCRPVDGIVAPSRAVRRHRRRSRRAGAGDQRRYPARARGDHPDRAGDLPVGRPAGPCSAGSRWSVHSGQLNCQACQPLPCFRRVQHFDACP